MQDFRTKSLNFLLILLLLPYFVSSQDAPRRLFKALFEDSGYTYAVRPVKDYRETVNVSIDLVINQLIEVDIVGGQLTVLYWQRMSWYDDFLKWDPADYDGLDQIKVTPDYPWLPEIVVFNNVQPIDYVRESHLPVGLRYDGLVHWDQPAIYVTTCFIHIRYFPYDEQDCFLQVGPWSSQANEIQIYNSVGSLTQDSYIENGEWALKDVSAKNIIYPAERGSYSLVQFNLYIQRRSEYYDMHLVYPTFLVSLLASVTFLLPAESGEKIGLCITVFLALCVNMLIVSDLMPSTSLEKPLLAEYFVMSITLVAISLIVTVFIINMSSPHPNARRPSKKVMDFCVKYLAPLVFLSRLRKPIAGVPFNPKLRITRNGVRTELEERGEEVECVDPTNPEHHVLEDDDDNNVLQQWLYLTRIMDRFFALVFFFITLGLSIVLIGRAKQNDM